MAKAKVTKKKAKPKKANIGPKAKGLFDHINQIREVQDPYYFDKLVEIDLKSWTNYMICRFLSMQPDLTESINELQKHAALEPKYFYQLLIMAVPKGRSYFSYIKSKNEKKWNKELIDLLRSVYEESDRNIEEYLNLLTDDQIRSMVSKYGFTEKEIENLVFHD
jgi:hypothetical protein